MNFRLVHGYLCSAGYLLSACLNGLFGAGALILTVLTASLSPEAKLLIHSEEGRAFLAAGWTERKLLHDLIYPPSGETAQLKLLVKMLDELQTPAGQNFAAAALGLAQRPELEGELTRARARLKKSLHTWLRSNAKARAAAAEFQTYGRSIESILDAYIDNAIHELTKARDNYPSFVSGIGETSHERPLERLGEILDGFFERYPLPDLAFVKNPPDQVSETAFEALNDKELSRQITALNFRKTVARPGGLNVAFQVEGESTDGIIAVGGFEFLRELEVNERCFVERYRHANGYPVVLSYEKGADLVAAPACLSTDLIGGTIAGPLNFHQVTILRVPLLGQLRPNLADKETRKAVIASTVNKLSGALWVLPPQTGKKFIHMLEGLFPAAMQDIAPRLPGSNESIWTSTRGQLIHAEKMS